MLFYLTPDALKPFHIVFLRLNICLQKVPVQQVPVRQVPVQQVPVRPPIATVTPINVSPNVMATPMAPMQSMVQPMTQSVKPITYNASTYRPTMRRNYGVLPGYRPVVPVANNNIATPGGYTTRTYRPRKL